MKKFTLFTLIVMVATSLSVKAQLQRGNVLVGTDLADISIGLNSPNVFNFDISPKAAWFIQDNLALGGFLNFGITSSKGSSTVTSYGIGPLGRYYTGSDVSVLSHGRFFFEGNVGFAGVDVSNGGGNTNGLNLGFGPGFAYFITPTIGLETLLKYNGVVGFGSQAYQSNLNLSFGFQIYLPGQATLNKVKGDMK
jgi:hypothetical protein